MTDKQIKRLHGSINNATHRFYETQKSLNKLTLSRENFAKKNSTEGLFEQELHGQAYLDFHRTCMETVMWIANAVEFIEKNAKKILKHNNRYTNEYNYLLGFKQVFNSFKHDMKIISLDVFNYDESIDNLPIQQVVWINSNLLTKKM